MAGEKDRRRLGREQLRKRVRAFIRRPDTQARFKVIAKEVDTARKTLREKIAEDLRKESDSESS